MHKHTTTKVRSINSNCRIETVATLYRDAYDFSSVGGVDLHAFLFSANKNHFFTSCQRLPTCVGELFVFCDVVVVLILLLLLVVAAAVVVGGCDDDVDECECMSVSA